jgi:hypothetical protein
MKYKNKTVQEESRSTPTSQVPIIAHILSGWPLVLVFIGGAIGGALGGLAYWVNLSLYKSRLPGVLKGVLNILMGLTAIGIWFLVVSIIRK